MLKWMFRLIGNTVVGIPIVVFFSLKPLNEANSTDNTITICLVIALLSWPVGWGICWFIDNREKYTFKI